jgi:predicted lipid-binding transport protein (Tim44 family)
MGDGFYLDILLFALVAAFLIFRLRSVLGRRDGFQGKGQSPLPTPQHPDRMDDAAAPAADGPDQRARHPRAAPVLSSAVEAGIAQISVADPGFTAEGFIDGAEKAFEWILSAFAKGDEQALQPLLSPEVFKNFSESIKQRQAAGETLESKLTAIDSTEISEAFMAGRTAHVGVKFVSRQISVIRDGDGKVLDGDPNHPSEVTDFWTFARDTRSADPNWLLVATGAPE